MSDDAALDLDAIRREIEQEVRARRAAGDYPPGFERELDDLFARFAPPAASGDFEAVLDQAEESAAISPVIPTESRKPAGAVVKQGLGKVLGWYHAWMSQQIVAFAGSTVRAVRILGGRVRDLETQLGDAGAAADAVADVVPRTIGEPAAQAVVDALLAAPPVGSGRVLVAESGCGTLLGALVAAGIDAYGCEPRAGLVADQRDRGLEVRAQAARSHLVAVPPGELAAVVLAGCTERSAPGVLATLAGLALGCCAPGGLLVVVSVRPEVFAAADPVAADLAPGRPVRPETWAHLLAGHGAVGVETRAFADEFVVTARRGDPAHS